jgi:hypothetical protein
LNLKDCGRLISEFPAKCCSGQRPDRRQIDPKSSIWIGRLGILVEPTKSRGQS